MAFEIKPSCLLQSLYRIENQGVRVNSKIVVWISAILIFIAVSSIASADPLENWHWRNPFLQGNDLKDVIYASNKFIGVGNSGSIIISDDGINSSVQKSGIDGLTWSERSSGTSSTLNAISYGNGTMVAVGSGALLGSTDGINWHNTEYPAWLASVAYGKQTFVAAGNAYSNYHPFAIILTSPDGMNWKQAYADPDPQKNNHYGSYLKAITYGNDKFVATGNRMIVYSADGGEWTEAQIPYQFYGITYGKNIFVAVGAGTIAISEDGISWTEVTNPEISLFSVVYGNGMFVAVGGHCDGFGRFGCDRGIYISTDGLNWTGTVTKDKPLVNVSYGYNRFISTDGALFSSRDGSQWEQIFFPAQANATAFINNTLVAVGESGTIIQSDSIVNKCAASVSPDLSTLHLPIVNYNGGFFWADLVREPTPDGSLVMRGVDYGAADPTLYSDCLAPTLTADFSRLHMPSVLYNTDLLWADMDSILSDDGHLRFRVNQFGTLGAPRCSATTTADFDTIHIPIISYAGSYFWADLEKIGTIDGGAKYKATRYGTADPNSYAGCQVSTLTGDFNSLMIPELLKDSSIMWAEMQVVPSIAEEIHFQMTAYGDY